MSHYIINPDNPISPTAKQTGPYSPVYVIKMAVTNVMNVIDRTNPLGSGNWVIDGKDIGISTATDLDICWSTAGSYQSIRFYQINEGKIQALTINHGPDPVNAVANPLPVSPAASLAGTAGAGAYEDALVSEFYPTLCVTITDAAYKGTLAVFRQLG